MLYPLAKRLLFQMDAEQAHTFTLKALNRAAQCGLIQPGKARIVLPRTVMGLNFPNPLGIAAGMDKNAEYLDGLGALGVGFVEAGTVTPRPQPGNPRPRVFRLPEVEGVINRLGFNNDGVDHFLQQVSRTHYSGILGINIGKNFDTPMENAVDDYVNALRRVYPHAHYVTINISSPNTRNLRELQGSDELTRLLTAIKGAQRELADQSGRHVPIALKIAPDLEPAQIDAIAKLLIAHGMDGVIATNTTISRNTIAAHPLAHEGGGLSGAPLHDLSLAVVQRLAHALDGALPIIGVGGINSVARAKAMLDAGASLIQLYTGLIYKGPGLIDEILQGLA